MYLVMKHRRSGPLSRRPAIRTDSAHDAAAVDRPPRQAQSNSVRRRFLSDPSVPIRAEPLRFEAFIVLICSTAFIKRLTIYILKRCVLQAYSTSYGKNLVVGKLLQGTGAVLVELFAQIFLR